MSDTFDRPIDGLDENGDDEEQTLSPETTGMAGSSEELSPDAFPDMPEMTGQEAALEQAPAAEIVAAEPDETEIDELLPDEALPEMAEVEEIIEEETAVEKAPEPAPLAGLKRFLARLFKREPEPMPVPDAVEELVPDADEGIEAVVEPVAGAVEEAVPVPVEATPRPEVVPAPEAPDVEAILAEWPEVVPEPEVVKVAPPEPEVAVEAVLAFTMDDVRALVDEELTRVREEMVRAQDDVARMVQAEVSREERARRHASLTAVGEMTEQVYTTKAETFRMEMDALHEEEQRTLKDFERPLRERMEDVDYIRERMVMVEQEITGHEQAVVRRAAESARVLAELEGRGIVAGMREELERQKQRVAAFPALVEQKVREAGVQRGRGAGGLGLWPALLALVLVALVGVAGVLLPRDAGPGAGFLVEMATMYQAAGETEEALRVLDEAVEAGLPDAASWARVASIYAGANHTEEAIDAYQEAIACSQDDKRQEYQAALAQMYAKNGQPEEAVAIYQQLAAGNPQKAAAYYEQLGKLFSDLRDYPRAIAAYQKVLEVAPSAAVYVQLGEIYMRQEQHDNAFEMYQKALELDPGNYQAHFRSGEYYRSQGDCEHAIQEYIAATEINSESKWPLIGLGACYKDAGEYETALEYYQIIAENHPEDPASFLRVGQMYLALGDCEQAVEQFNQVLELDPDNQAAKDGLSECQ